jgi:hypothetical protein
LSSTLTGFAATFLTGATFLAGAAFFATAFFAAIKDRTLPENKSIQDKEHEKEVLNNLAKVANVLNNDETQPEGIGSVALIKLLLETVLYQRDLINILGYNTSVLDSKIKK